MAKISGRALLVAAVVLVAAGAGGYIWLPKLNLGQRQSVSPNRLNTASAPAAPQAGEPIAPPPLTFEPISSGDALVSNAQVPLSTLPNPPAAKFKLNAKNPTDSARALECLTQAVYYEAGFEGLAGQQAIAQAVLNRVRHPLFPHTICGVVYQGSRLPTGCQFSFTCDGSLARPPNPLLWTQAKSVAQAALDGFVAKPVGLATHYHSDYVVASWRDTMVKHVQIGSHIFYSWPGVTGAPGVVLAAYAGSEPPPAVMIGPMVDAANANAAIIPVISETLAAPPAPDTAPIWTPPPLPAPPPPPVEVAQSEPQVAPPPPPPPPVAPRRRGGGPPMSSQDLSCSPGRGSC